MLVRVDFNVPMQNGEVTDATRIERACETLEELVGKGAKVVVLSHFGRPKGKAESSMSLKPIVKPLSQALGGIDVRFAPDCIGDLAHAVVDALPDGGVALLENLRFHAGEEKGDPAFADQLATLGELYVNDAFSVSHRAHASVTGLAERLPAYAGRLMQAELEALEAALGGAQRPTAARDRRRQGVEQARRAGPRAGPGRRADHRRRHGQHLPQRAGHQRRQVPVRARSGRHRARDHGQGRGQERRDRPADRRRGGRRSSRPAPQTRTVAGRRSDARRHDPRRRAGQRWPRSSSGIAGCKTLLWNGPMGAFEIEPFDRGTNAVAQAAARLTQAGKLTTVAGGGDTVAALAHAGVLEQFSYVSTAGGAFLEWLEGKELPGVAALARH